MGNEFNGLLFLACIINYQTFNVLIAFDSTKYYIDYISNLKQTLFKLEHLCEKENLLKTEPEIQNDFDKIWSAILDGKTRPDHSAADGQRVGLEESFIVGGELLRFPRDPDGSLAQIANCRCEEFFVKKDNVL